MAEPEIKPILKDSVDFELPDGKIVKIGPINQDGFESISKWIRLRYLQNIRSIIADFPQHEQDVILARAVKDAALMSVRTEDGLQVLYESVHGYSRLCYELIQNPTITFEDFERIIFPDENDYSKYAKTLNDMFFAVYDEMFVGNIASMVAEEAVSDEGSEEEEEEEEVSLQFSGGYCGFPFFVHPFCCICSCVSWCIKI